MKELQRNFSTKLGLTGKKYRSAKRGRGGSLLSLRNPVTASLCTLVVTLVYFSFRNGIGIPTPSLITQGKGGKAFQPKYHVLVVHHSLPRPKMMGCDLRLMQVIHSLRSMGTQVGYMYRFDEDRKQMRSSRRHLRRLGIEVFGPMEDLDGDGDGWHHKLGHYHRKLSKYRHALLFLWYFDHAWPNHPSVAAKYVPALRTALPGVRSVIVSDDVHSRRELMLAYALNSTERMDRATKMRSAEQADLSSVERVVAVTEEDAARIRQEFRVNATVLPMAVAAGDADADGKPDGMATPRRLVRSKKGKGVAAGRFADRFGFVFVGGPNVVNALAIKWLLTEIWPAVLRKVPGAKLHIVGNLYRGVTLPKMMNEMGVKEGAYKMDGVRMLGFVKDLGDVFARVRVFLAPISTGTGVNTKNIVAMQNHIPVVTTGIGAEGFGVSNTTQAATGSNAGSEFMMVESETDAFVRAAVRVHNDEQLWKALSVNGYNHIREHFGPKRLNLAVSDMLEKWFGSSQATLNASTQNE